MGRSGRATGREHAFVWLLVPLDAALFSTALLGAIAAGLQPFTGPTWGAGGPLGIAWIDGALALGWPLALAVSGAYSPRALGLGLEEYRAVLLAGLRLLAVGGLVNLLLGVPLNAGYLFAVVGIGTLLSLIGRYCARKWLHRQWARGVDNRRLLLVGDPGNVERLLFHLDAHQYAGFRPVGVVVAKSIPGVEGPSGLVPRIGHPDALLDILDRVDVDTIAVSDSGTLRGDGLRGLSWAIEDRDIDLMVVPSVTDVAGPRISVRPVGGLPLLHVEKPELSGLARATKAAVDRVGAILLLVVLSPAAVAIAIAVRATSNGPAFFRQERVGVGGVTFQMLKFRTMASAAPSDRSALADRDAGAGPLFKVRDDPRITSLGRRLRRHSIDEAPQLWNVLRGQMSLVGPRPPLPEEVAAYDGPVHRRLRVKPGMTGLWQVSGRSELSWDETVRLDLEYVDDWSLVLDLQILLRTVPVVIRGTGAY